MVLTVTFTTNGNGFVLLRFKLTLDQEKWILTLPLVGKQVDILNFRKIFPLLK